MRIDELSKVGEFWSFDMIISHPHNILEHTLEITINLTNSKNSRRQLYEIKIKVYE